MRTLLRIWRPLLASVASLSAALALRAAEYGDIDPSRFPPSGWQAYQWTDPGSWITIDVSAEGLPPNDKSIDAAKKLPEIVARHATEKIKLSFPAGTFYFYGDCLLKKPGGWLIVSGAGKDKTHFIMDAPPDQLVGIAIIASGLAESRPVGIPAAVKRGDQTIVGCETGGFRAGDDVLIQTPPATGRPAKRGQIARIVSLSGDKIAIDMKVGLDLASATLTKLQLGENCGFERLHFLRKNDAPIQAYNLKLEGCRHGFVWDCESQYVVTGGIKIDGCRDIIVTRNFVHDPIGAIKGGRQDGIMVLGFATGIHITDNFCANLRHHYWLGECNHCVVSYNRAEGFLGYGDYGQHNGHNGHNNLFEGNAGSDLCTDDYGMITPAKPNGGSTPTWYITWFRNRASDRVGSVSKYSEDYVIVGNEVASAIMETGPKPFYTGGNIVAGKMQWGALAPAAKIPASLVYSAKPDYVAQWPLYGPAAAADPAKSGGL